MEGGGGRVEGRGCSVDASKACFCVAGRDSCVEGWGCCVEGWGCCVEGRSCWVEGRVCCVEGRSCWAEGRVCCVEGRGCCVKGRGCWVEMVSCELGGGLTAEGKSLVGPCGSWFTTSLGGSLSPSVTEAAFSCSLTYRRGQGV